MGIQHQRIQPASPQQNGARERMHNTLNAGATRPPKSNVAAQHKQYHVGLEETADGIWSLYLGAVLLGKIDEREMRVYG